MDETTGRDDAPPIEVRPDPGEARAAIDAALTVRREADATDVGEGAWWRAGVEESVHGGLERD